MTVGVPMLVLLIASLVAVWILFAKRKQLLKTMSEDLVHRMPPWTRVELPAEHSIAELDRFGRFGHLFHSRRGSRRSERQQEEQQEEAHGEQRGDQQLENGVLGQGHQQE